MSEWIIVFFFFLKISDIEQNSGFGFYLRVAVYMIDANIFSGFSPPWISRIITGNFWGVWLKVYQFYLSFQRITSWFHWFFFLLTFSIVFLVSCSFIFALIFIISFLLLTLGFVLLFLVPLVVSKVWLRFFLFLEVGLYCYEFPLRTAFVVSQRFWTIVFSSVSIYIFLISSLISLLTHWLFSSMSFSLHMLVFFPAFSCDWFLVSYCCGQKRCLIGFQSP